MSQVLEYIHHAGGEGLVNEYNDLKRENHATITAAIDKLSGDSPEFYEGLVKKGLRQYLQYSIEIINTAIDMMSGKKEGQIASPEGERKVIFPASERSSGIRGLIRSVTNSSKPSEKSTNGFSKTEEEFLASLYKDFNVIPGFKELDANGKRDFKNYLFSKVVEVVNGKGEEMSVLVSTQYTRLALETGQIKISDIIATLKDDKETKLSQKALADDICHNQLVNHQNLSATAERQIAASTSSAVAY